MKKIIVVILITSIILTLCGCGYDPYSGTRPFDYGNAVWVCEDPEIWFEIDINTDDYDNSKGEITINDQTFPCILYFIEYVNYVDIKVFYGEVDNVMHVAYLEGECVFSPQEFIIKIDKETDTIFDGKYDELVFVRNAYDSESSAP